MSHKFRKPKPISEPRRAVAGNGLVLTTESKEKYDALLASYRDEYDPQGQTENDLVEELTAAKWLQRRTLSMITALLDVTMDLMDKEIKEQFDTIDNTTRTALAFAKQAGQTAALDLMHRYAARHARDYHRALDKLRKIQSENRGPCILQNEPKPPVTILPASTSGHRDNAQSETGHRPPATGHCLLQNEPKPPVTPGPPAPSGELDNAESENWPLIVGPGGRSGVEFSTVARPQVVENPVGRLASALHIGRE